jgi:vacuolar-type H+-ATPase subunit F/Vma7
MKYFLSLCCIIKDEDYLEEFILYYRILGVEHFYIYDNESSIPISKRLNNKFYKEKCTIINFPGKARQMEAYINCLNKSKNETKWLIIVDGDEYILPKNHFSLRDFLKEYDNYQAIGINWVMFGSNFYDKKQDGYLIDKYRYCEGVQNKHIKTICKPEFVINMNNPHYVNIINSNKYVDPNKNIICGPFNDKNNIGIIQINHYWGKSAEDHYQKRDRGRATTLDKRVIDENPHEKYNNFIDDLLPNKYLEKLIDLKLSIN